MPVVPSLILMAPTLNKKNNSGKNKKQIKNKKINKKNWKCPTLVISDQLSTETYSCFCLCLHCQPVPKIQNIEEWGRQTVRDKGHGFLLQCILYTTEKMYS